MESLRQTVWQIRARQRSACKCRKGVSCHLIFSLGQCSQGPSEMASQEIQLCGHSRGPLVAQASARTLCLSSCPLLPPVPGRGCMMQGGV